MELTLRETFSKTYQNGNTPPALPRIIDPKSPIASLAAGPQQFTTIADTDHASGKIMESVAKEIPRLAQAGVKHLMLEFYINPVGSPNRDMLDRQNENILARLNSRPPTITEEEILANSPLFKSTHEKKEKNETGTAYAHLLIAAMKHGVTVHFAGDDRGMTESLLLDVINSLHEDYLKKHKKLERFSQALANDPNFIEKLNWPQHEKDQLSHRTTHHRAWLDQSYQDWQTTYEKYHEKRMGQDAENDRAARFIELAQGEKSVVVFGRDHFRKESDLNEAIDNQLKSQALAKGQPIPEKTAVAEIWDSRAEHTKWLKKSKEDETISRSPSLRIFADTGAVEIPEDFAQHYKFGTVKAQQLVQNVQSPSPAP